MKPGCGIMLRTFEPQYPATRGRTLKCSMALAMVGLSIARSSSSWAGVSLAGMRLLVGVWCRCTLAARHPARSASGRLRGAPAIIAWQPGCVSIVTIGKFDGVHLGHRSLLRQMADYAHARGVDACVVTFDRHPFEVLRPAAAPLRLSTVSEKVRLLRQAGADAVWVCPFTLELARLEPAEFIALVRERWPLQELWVGEGFALGRN